MYEDGENTEEILTFNFLFCQSCLSSNRTLTVVGEYMDIYTKICDIQFTEDMASEIWICWECMALLKKIRTFKKKVENAQKILDYCINTQVPLYSLSDFTVSSTETTTFVPIDIDEYQVNKSDLKTDSEDLSKSDLKAESEVLSKSDIKMEYEDPKDDLIKLDMRYQNMYDLKELTIKIEDVRSQLEVAKMKPVLDLSLNSSSECETTVKDELLTPEADQAYRRWKQSIMLIHKRICAHQHAHHFLRPVSDDIAPHYSAVVRRPADLGTLRRYIKDGTIRTTAQFERELLLMFSNALMYNSSDDPIYHMALELRAEALRELSLLSDPQDSPRTRRRSPLSMPLPTTSPPKNQPESKPAGVARRRASRRHRDHTYFASPPVQTPTNLKPLKPESETKPPSVAHRRDSQRPRDTPPAAVTRRRASQWAGAEPTAKPKAAASKRRASTLNWSPLDTDFESELLVARHSTKKYKTVLL